MHLNTACMHVYSCISYTCIYIYVNIYVYIHNTHMHTYMYTYTHTYIHAHTHTHTRLARMYLRTYTDILDDLVLCMFIVLPKRGFAHPVAAADLGRDSPSG